MKKLTGLCLIAALMAGCGGAPKVAPAETPTVVQPPSISAPTAPAPAPELPAYAPPASVPPASVPPAQAPAVPGPKPSPVQVPASPIGSVVSGDSQRWERPANGIEIWASAGANSPLPPQLMELSALERDGEVLIPIAAAVHFGPLRRAGATAYAVALPDGSVSHSFETVTVDGQLYVSVANLMQAIDGSTGGTAVEVWTFGVDWRPELRQLILWADRHRR